MALETIGVLVNIAGDTGGLVNAVQKARDAFTALTTKTKAVSQESMPAFQRLQHQIDAVTARTNIASRMQAEYKTRMDVTAMAVKNTSDRMAKLTADFSRFEYGGVKPSEAAVKKYDSEMEKLTGVLAKQDEQLRKSTKGYQDYTDKIAAATARTEKLKGEQAQVRTPDQKSTAQRLFDALGAGAGVFNIGASMLGQLGKLFGGKGGPAMGGRTARDDMAFDKMAVDIRAVGDSIPVVNVGFRTMAAAMAVGQVAANAFLGVLHGIVSTAVGVTQSIVGLGIQSTIAAGRNQELAIVSQFMGQQAGHSSYEIDKTTASLKKAGASIAAANDTVTQFSRSNMDLTKSTQLLSVAQGAAIIAGQDSSAVMQQLIYGIITLQPEMLRTAGIVINADEAYKRYAADLKVNVNALTGEQKQQAFLNETLREGAKLQGLYAEAMKLPGKQLRSLTDREIPDFLSQLGAPFQGVFKIVVESLRSAVKWLTDATVEGGKLYPIMQALGGAVEKVSITISALVNAGGAAFDSMITSWSEKIASFITNAGTWGSNLVVSFANGIISGAGAVLDALSYIGSMVAYWLAPGSPPKLLPELTRWGQEAIGEYMKGWTQADLSTFDELSGKLEGVIKSMEDSFGKTGTVPAIQAMRINISNAVQEMSDFGNITAGTMNRIASAFGGTGILVRNYISAVVDVTNAQKELDEVTKKYDDQLNSLNEQLNALTEKKTENTEEAQIKALQRVMTRVSTTDKQKVAAQAEIEEIQLRKKIRLTENEKDTSVKAAQEKLNLANKTLVIQQALLDSQQRNNDLMREQANILEQLARAAEKAAAAAAAAAGGTGKGYGTTAAITKPSMTGTYMPGMQGQTMGVGKGSPIQSVLDKLAELKGKWESFKSGWDEFWQKPQVQNVARSLEYVWNNIQNGTFTVDTLKTAIKSLLPKEDQKKFEDAWNVLSRFASKEMKDSSKNINDLGTAFGKFTAAMGGEGGTNPLLAFFAGLVDAVLVKLPLFIRDVLGLATTFILGLKTIKDFERFITQTLIGTIIKIYAKFKEWDDKINEIKNAIDGGLRAALSGLSMYILITVIGAVNGIKGAFQGVTDFMNNTVIPAFNTLKDFFLNTIIPLALNPLRNILDDLWGKAQGVIDAINWIAGHLGKLKDPGKGYAEGGAIRKGVPSLVGERGMEMFVPKSDGFILPNDFLKSMVKMAMPASYINTNSGNNMVQNVRNNYLTVNSSVPSQGLVADWTRLTVLGA